jgi:hypothetical protein
VLVHYRVKADAVAQNLELDDTHIRLAGSLRVASQCRPRVRNEDSMNR